MAEITVYGAAGCKDTRRTREHLEELGAEYAYVDVEQDSRAEQFVREQNEGKRRTPTVVLAGPNRDDCGGPAVLRVPSDSTLDEALDQQGLLPLSDAGDGSPGLRGAVE